MVCRGTISADFGLFSETKRPDGQSEAKTISVIPYHSPKGVDAIV